MVSYLGSLVQFSPAAGRVGRCRQMSLCVGSTRRALARQPAVLAPSPRVVPFPSASSGPGSQMLGALSTGTPRLFPPRPQRALPVGSQGVFRQDPGPVCRVGGRSGLRESSDRTRGLFAGWEGVASLGLSFPLAPPPPPTSSGDGAALLWSFSVPLFCEPPAVCSGRSVFPSLSHSLKNLPPTALRAFWPVPTLRNAAGSSPFRPLLLMAGAGIWGYFSAGSCF